MGDQTNSGTIGTKKEMIKMKRKTMTKYWRFTKRWRRGTTVRPAMRIATGNRWNDMRSVISLFASDIDNETRRGVDSEMLSLTHE